MGHDRVTDMWRRSSVFRPNGRRADSITTISSHPPRGQDRSLPPGEPTSCDVGRRSERGRRRSSTARTRWRARRVGREGDQPMSASTLGIRAEDRPGEVLGEQERGTGPDGPRRRPDRLEPLSTRDELLSLRSTCLVHRPSIGFGRKPLEGSAAGGIRVDRSLSQSIATDSRQRCLDEYPDPGWLSTGVAAHSWPFGGTSRSGLGGFEPLTSWVRSGRSNSSEMVQIPHPRAVCAASDDMQIESDIAVDSRR
jgi:hypothetical protein